MRLHQHSTGAEAVKPVQGCGLPPAALPDLSTHTSCMLQGCLLACKLQQQAQLLSPQLAAAFMSVDAQP